MLTHGDCVRKLFMGIRRKNVGADAHIGPKRAGRGDVGIATYGHFQNIHQESWVITQDASLFSAAALRSKGKHPFGMEANGAIKIWCHSEPARTPVWESPGSSNIYI